jgi:hypothetical protein
MVKTPVCWSLPPSSLGQSLPTYPAVFVQLIQVVFHVLYDESYVFLSLVFGSGKNSSLENIHFMVSTIT